MIESARQIGIQQPTSEVTFFLNNISTEQRELLLNGSKNFKFGDFWDLVSDADWLQNNHGLTNTVLNIVPRSFPGQREVLLDRIVKNGLPFSHDLHSEVIKACHCNDFGMIALLMPHLSVESARKPFTAFRQHNETMSEVTESIFHMIVATGNINKIKAIFERLPTGLTLDEVLTMRSSWGYTVLDEAVAKGDSVTAEWLIAQGAKSGKAQKFDDSGATPVRNTSDKERKEPTVASDNAFGRSSYDYDQVHRR